MCRHLHPYWRNLLEIKRERECVCVCERERQRERERERDRERIYEWIERGVEKTLH